jgi:hypothetical protein
VKRDLGEPLSARARGGDPEGRRVAKRKAQRLAEAGRLSRALELLLDRAEFAKDEARALTDAITDEERSQLLRAEGHIEGRKRFKGGPLVRVTDPDRHLLYLDESGKSLHAGTDYFALGGVALTGAEARRYRRRANAIKRRFWGHTSVTFHEPPMRRRSDTFDFGGDVDKQTDFDAALDRLIDEIDFVVFGVGIRKKAFAEFHEAGDDPYLPTDMYAAAIQMLLERYVDYRAMLGPPRSFSRVIFESQGELEDALHQREFADVLINGTQWVSASAFRQWLETGVDFTWKHGADPMELADMVSRDIYEWLESGCKDWPGRWRALSAKIYCRGDRAHGKFGVKVFPDSDIRDAVEEHRRLSGGK